MSAQKITSLVFFMLFLVFVIFNINTVIAYKTIKNFTYSDELKQKLMKVTDPRANLILKDMEAHQLEQEKTLRNLGGEVVILTVIAMLSLISSIGIWRGKKFAYLSAMIVLVWLIGNEVQKMFLLREGTISHAFQAMVWTILLIYTFKVRVTLSAL